MQNYVHSGTEWKSGSICGKEERRRRKNGREREGQEIPLCMQETLLHMLIAAWTTSSITVKISPGGERMLIGWRWIYKSFVRFTPEVWYVCRD